MSLLKVFDTVSSYETAKEGDVISYPNISFIDEDGSVRYINKPSWITATYDVPDSGEIQFFTVGDLSTNTSSIDKVVFDDGGVIYSNDFDNNWRYTFSTPGLHTVEYHFKNDVDITIYGLFVGGRRVVDVDFSNFDSSRLNECAYLFTYSDYYDYPQNPIFLDLYNVNLKSYSADPGYLVYSEDTPIMAYINANTLSVELYDLDYNVRRMSLIDAEYLIENNLIEDYMFQAVFSKAKVYWREDYVTNMFGYFPESFKRPYPLPVMFYAEVEAGTDYVPLPWIGVYDFLFDENNMRYVEGLMGLENGDIQLNVDGSISIADYVFINNKDEIKFIQPESK